jgi:hypothetical protein
MRPALVQIVRPYVVAREGCAGSRADLAWHVRRDIQGGQCSYENAVKLLNRSADGAARLQAMQGYWLQCRDDGKQNVPVDLQKRTQRFVGCVQEGSATELHRVLLEWNPACAKLQVKLQLKE